ncbi:MAG: hypothetical protein Q3M24_15475 [Candidatus Electrothrix aestuarii]|uniref:Uncharacterized protein n=1 Tax=Candidatus Electrothrix aestuarii TaxID=3062594 RepID=A0AAU8LR01_9BACT|nr:hypothetical protein [Candidatus Electrothrix aestuarii]
MEHSPEEYSKHIDVTELDATLPSTSLHDWLNGLAKASERVAWEFNDCGEQTGSEADRGRDFPKCLEGIIESPSHERALSIQVYVGTWQRGFVGKPKLGLISYTRLGQLAVGARSLSTLKKAVSGAKTEGLLPFLRAGDVWMTTETAQEIQLTNTDNKIDKLELSPSGRYVAANKIIDYYEQENDLENPTSYTLEPIYSVLIIDLNARKVIADLKAPKAMTHPLGWKADETYDFGEGTVGEITAEYLYNPVTGQVKKVHYE